MQFPYNISPLSESAIIISFQQIIDEQLNSFIRFLDEQINAKPFRGFVETVPAYASLTIYFDLLKIPTSKGQTSHDFVKSYVEKLLANLRFENADIDASSVVEIPVMYDGEDLAFVCKETGLSEVEFVRLHTEPLYRVYMLGFLPGFAYLGGMDRRLAVPRRGSPRLKVPAGSVGIAGEQTGVYPVESPGGWQLIGRTEMPLFTPDDKSLTLIKQGDYVKFVAVG